MRALLAVALSWAACAGPALALEPPALQGRVNDYARLLSDAEKARLDQKLTAYEQSTKRQFVLLTVPSLEGDAIEDFGVRTASRWKLGDEKADDGLLLIVAVADRKLRIEVGYGLEGSITDVFSARLIREVITPAFKNNQFAEGIEAGFDALMRQASGEAPPPAAEQRASRERKRVAGKFSPLIFPILLFIVITLLAGGGRGGRRRRGMFLGGPFLGGGGGGFGGGWGSGGGGGGFGGGGGGGFGGGGASGNW